MLRRISYVLVLFLSISIFINAQNESTSTVPFMIAETTTEKSIETTTFQILGTITTANVEETSTIDLPSVTSADTTTNLPSATSADATTKLPSVISEDTTTNLPSTTSADATTKLPSVTSEDTTTNLPSATSADATTKLPSVTSEDTTTNLPSATSADATTKLPSVTSEDTTTNLPSATSADATTKLPSVISEDTTTNLPSTTSADATTKLPSVTSEDTTTNLPSATSADATTKLPSVTSEDTTTNLPSATSADATTKLPSVTSEDTTTNLPSATSADATTKLPSVTSEDTTTNLPSTTSADATTNLSSVISADATTNLSSVISEDTTTNLPSVTSEDTTTDFLQLETTTSLGGSEKDHIETSTPSSQNTEPFSHLDKPTSTFVEPSVPKFPQDDLNMPADEFTQNIIVKLAEYIQAHTINSSLGTLPIPIDVIINELANKLDKTELNFNNNDLNEIRAVTKIILKNLSMIIKTIISSIDIVGDENCSIKFTFLQNTYCIKFEFDMASLGHAINLHSTEIGTNPSTNVSVASFKVFNLHTVDTPPTLWQQWLNLPSAADQLPSSTSDSPVLVCYYTNWAQYRNGPGRFYPENMDPKLCTHIVYSFAKLENGIIAPYEWNDESTAWSTGMYARMMNLRKASRPKILLALGGWNHGSGKFSDMVRNATKRATFVTTTLIFLEKHRFDGLDLDWEYPGSREGSRSTDKEDFTKLVTELKKAFRPLGLLLTAAVGAGKSTIDAAYDIPKICEQLDLINLMSYDLHGAWESQTGINSPLYSRANDTQLNKQLTQDWAVRYWLDKGCPKSKLVMGLATYGRTFRLANTANNQIGAPAVGPGAAGLYTGEAGFLAYYEICTRIQQQGWKKVFDEEQKSNYAYKGQEWVGFDDAHSFSYKVKYAKDMGLAGLMFWAPDLDDFTGSLCNEGKYPLMNTAVKLLRGEIEWVPSSNTSSPVVTTTSTVGPTDEQQKRIVCYYTNWAQYRPEGGKFVPENLDASLCTHIIYAFAVLKDSKLVPFEWNDEDNEWSKGMYTRTLELRKTHGVKVLLAVGGWNFGSGAFSDLVKDDKLRKEFVQQATKFIRDHGFDGFDLDWEYPGSREGSRPEDKQHFTTLVKELKEAFTPHNLLLTAAVGAGAATIEKGYEIEKIAPHLDFINLMTYDLHGGSWENSTGFHTALYARPEERNNETTLNQNWAVNYWITEGMPKEKISMGLAFYGRTFKLVNSSDTSIGAPGSGPGEAGKYTREPGFLAYYEICEKLKDNGWISKYDDIQKSMYAYGEGDWVGYDSIDTLTMRANYIIGKDLGGVMIWAPDLDDFSGNFCGRGRYPLLNTVVNIIRTNTIVPVVIPTDPTTTSTTTTATTTQSTTLTPESTTTTTKRPVLTSTPRIPTPTTTTATLTSTSSPISTSSPSSVVSQPSVVCMSPITPFVFRTLNANLCSHLILVQEERWSTKSDIFESSLSTETLEHLKKIKTVNSQLKIFYSILGQWKPKHLDLIRNEQERTTFNKEIQQYLIDNNLDGFDIDWNLRANDISSINDKNYLSTWLLELQTIFASSGLSLSIGVNGDKVVLDNSYDFDILSNAVDFIRFMAFDWPSNNVTTLINPLYPKQIQQGNDQFNNINWALAYVTTLGIAPEKISLGLPTYGRLFELVNRTQNTIGAPVLGTSMTVAYSDICKLLENSDYIKVYDEQSRSTYAFNEKRKQWISSDAINDVALKARFAKLQGLGGVTLSSIGMDDVSGQCDNGPYPLLHAVADVFNLKKEKTIDHTNIPHSQHHQSGQSTNIICSVSSQVEKYSGSTVFTLDRLNTHLCTHLLIDHSSSLLTGSISKGLKNTNKDLKILLTIHSDEELNVEQWKDMLTDKNADGINININNQTISPEFTQQIKTIRSTLSNTYLLTISFETPTDATEQVSFFNILSLHPHVDYLLLLPFDGKSIANHTEIQPWNSLATFIKSNSNKNIRDISMISTLMFIVASGVPKEKLIMSIPTYGLTFLLEDENKYQLGDEIVAQGFPGRQTRTVGMLASYEICKRIQSDEYQRFLSDESITVIAHKKTNLILFDDTQPLKLTDTNIVNGTVELKATVIKNSQLAGVLVHSIDLDDFTGLSCGRGAFPITSVISRVISSSASRSNEKTTTTMATSTEKTGLCSNVKTPDLLVDEDDCHYYYACIPNQAEPAAHLRCPVNKYFSALQKACADERSPCSSESKINPIETTTVTTTSQSNTEFICPKRNGLFPDISDCTRYFMCSNNRPISFQCPLTTKFNSQSNRCDWSSDLCP